MSVPGGINPQFLNLGFDPEELFANGEYGGLYVPSDISTLWQDTAGTTPVTASGQSIARIDDKSGNGLNLILTGGSGVTYGTDGNLHWIDFDGASYFETSALTAPLMNNGEGSMAFSAASDQSEALAGVLAEQQAAPENSRRIVMFFDTRSGTKRHSFFSPDGTTRAIDLDSEIDGTAKVFIMSHDGSTARGYIDNTAQSSTLTPGGSFNASRFIQLGRQQAGPFYFDGKLYGAVIRDTELTTAQRNNLNAYLATKAGI
ncbi:hypothetical protein [Methylophaga sp. OBS4]|uniref:hypothetical protein n=1 Tax=Methylophaga sp. OBS4 TaxID=2991935 RepID=UPI00224CC231|nr:hypothetical protein [Methylophaga sp. OBS4]MCX4186781.1 hypothetical protein [Methylophaga sp. OBS4]